MKNKHLTPEEERVIIHKGTEAPFSGEYDNFFREGTKSLHNSFRSETEIMVE